MRLIIKVGKNYYYDIGLRSKHDKTGKITRSFGEDHPKFLQDFIEFYKKDRIQIISYGSLKEKEDEINKLIY
jgi:hypothetical protein